MYFFTAAFAAEKFSLSVLKVFIVLDGASLSKTMSPTIPRILAKALFAGIYPFSLVNPRGLYPWGLSLGRRAEDILLASPERKGVISF